jgi:hypothetical protein
MHALYLIYYLVMENVVTRLDRIIVRCERHSSTHFMSVTHATHAIFRIRAEIMIGCHAFASQIIFSLRDGLIFLQSVNMPFQSLHILDSDSILVIKLTSKK